MNRRLAAQVEIETLHELLPELDYYRLLQLAPDSPQEDVDAAWRRESRRLHPDRFAAIPDRAVKQKAGDVFKLVSEAWRTLRDPEARSHYDAERTGGPGGARGGAEAVAAADRERAAAADPEKAATNPKSEKYWKMALQNWRASNFKGCVMQIQFALSFEPDNATFLEWMEKAKVAADDTAKKERNPYKLRIV